MDFLFQKFAKPDQGQAVKEVSTNTACQPSSAAFKVTVSRKRKGVHVLLPTRDLASLARVYVHRLDVGGG